MPKKDNFKPRPVRRAFQFFQKENRVRISLKYPKCSSKEVATLTYKEFASLNAKKNKIYIAMHEADKMRFEQKMRTNTPLTMQEMEAYKEKAKIISE